MLGAVHLSPVVTVPIALVVVVWALWYWTRLGAAPVPVSRRWIRRASLIVILGGLPALVRGASFVDPSIDPIAYTQTWTVAIGALVLLVLCAVIDAVNSVRLHAIDQAALLGRHFRPRDDARARHADAPTDEVNDDPPDDPAPPPEAR